jgi:hypothetical protein
MTQDERWDKRYQEVVDFLKKNRRNPSKYNLEERNMWTFVKHSRKQMNQGLLKPDRRERFCNLLELASLYRHKNQYE